MKTFLNFNLLVLICAVMFLSCVSKRQVLYMQDVKTYKETDVIHEQTSFQVDDILKISIGALNPEAALPYNVVSPVAIQANNVEVIKLEGYLVSQNFTINFPVLGEISIADKNTKTLSLHIKELLEKGGYLINPTVMVRLLNAKVTVLGEVKNPGTFTYTENSISLFQALGLAGDLTINGSRDDVVIIRESSGKRIITHLDLTSTEWIKGPFQNMQPNDVIVVNPNTAKIKSAGVVGNASVVLGIASVILSSIIVLSR
ncbi:MAG: polysaccharide export outer membrane protein [Glaciecola sp.]|jgi:polysaccharide export outer membrane protein